MAISKKKKKEKKKYPKNWNKRNSVWYFFPAKELFNSKLLDKSQAWGVVTEGLDSYQNFFFLRLQTCIVWMQLKRRIIPCNEKFCHYHGSPYFWWDVWSLIVKGADC